VVVNGKMEILSIKIDPDVLAENDPEIVETLVAAAVNEGIKKAHDLIKDKMSDITGGMDIPGLT